MLKNWKKKKVPINLNKLHIIVSKGIVNDTKIIDNALFLLYKEIITIY